MADTKPASVEDLPAFVNPFAEDLPAFVNPFAEDLPAFVNPFAEPGVAENIKRLEEEAAAAAAVRPEVIPTLDMDGAPGSQGAGVARPQPTPPEVAAVSPEVIPTLDMDGAPGSQGAVAARPELVPEELAPVVAQEPPPSSGYVTEELIDSLIMAESSGKRNQVSPVGAEGVGQVMPRTGENPGFGVKPLQNSFDPVENRRFATEYLEAMAQRYGGDIEAALIAYNAGYTNADKFLAAGRDYSALPMPEETQPYVAKILGNVTAAPAAPAAEPPQERSDFIDASKGTWNLLTNIAPKTIGLLNESLVAEGFTEKAEGYAAVDQGLSDKELREKFGARVLAIDTGGRGEVGWLKLYQLASPERRAEITAELHGDVENVTQRILDKIPALTAAQQKGEQYAPRVAGVTDIKKFGDFTDWLQYNMTAGAIQLAPIMGAAFVAGPVGAGVVSTALATSEAISARLGFINEVVKDLSKEDQAKAITKYLQDTKDTTAMVALVSGLLDLSGPVYSIVRGNFAKELGEEVVERTTFEVAKQSGKRAVGEVAQEGVTGGLQETTQIAGELSLAEQGEGATLFSPENLKRIADAAAAEAAGSVGVSTAGFVATTGVAGLQNRSRARSAAEIQAVVQKEIVRLRELPENADKTDAQLESSAVETVLQDAPNVMAEVIAKGEIQEALPNIPASEVNRLAELPPVERETEVIRQINAAEVAAEIVELKADPRNEGKTEVEIEALVESRMSEGDILATATAIVAADTETTTASSKLPGPLQSEVVGFVDKFLDTGSTTFNEQAAQARKSIAETYGEEAAAFYEAEVRNSLPSVQGVQDASNQALQPQGIQVATQGRPVKEPLNAKQKAAAQKAKRAKDKEASQLRRTGLRDVKVLETPLDSFWGQRQAPTKEAYEAVEKRLAESRELIDADLASQEVVAQQAKDRTQLNEWDQYIAGRKNNLSIKRVDAIVSALETLNNASNKAKPAVTKRAQEALDNPSITEAELQEANQIIQAKQESNNAQALEIAESTNSEPNPAFLGAPNLMSILDSIVENGNEFETALTRLLKPFLENTELVIVTTASDLPANLVKAFSGALGLYVSETNTIYLNATTGTNNTVVLHESLHAATIDALVSAIVNPNAVSPKLRKIVREIQGLMVAARNKYEADKNIGNTTSAMDKLAGEDISIFTDIREFVAYGLTQPELQEFLSTVDSTLSWKLSTLENGLSSFLDLVRQIFNVADKDYSAFIALTDLTEKLLIESAVYRRISSNEIAKAKQVSNKATRVAKKVAESNTQNLGAAMEEQAKVVQSGTEGASLLSNLLNNANATISPNVARRIIAAMGTGTILKQKGGEIKNLYAMNEVVREVTQYKQKFLKDVVKETKKWEQFNSKFKDGAIILAEVMHWATLHQFDPSKYANMAAALANDKTLKDLRAKYKKVANDPTSSQGAINAAKGAGTTRENIIREGYEGSIVDGVLIGGWNRLQEKSNGAQEGVRLYKMAHKKYKDNLAEFQSLTVKEIKDRKLKDKAKEKEILKRLADMFAESNLMEVYFPLMRYGDFYAGIKKTGKGQVGSEFRIFRTFATMSERDLYLDQYIQKVWGTTTAIETARRRNSLIEDGVIQRGNTTDPTRMEVEQNQGSGELLKDIFGLLDSTAGGPTQAGLNAKEVETLKDSVYQMYIQTLPTADLRRGLIHRKGIAGFSNDVLRNFVTSQLSRANQLARLKYNGKLQRATEQAYAELDNSVWQERNTVWVDVFAERTSSTMRTDPRDMMSLIQSFGTSAVFVFMLTAPASAVVNMTQIHIVGTTILERDFGYLRTQAVQKRYLLTMFNKFGRNTLVTNEDGSVTVDAGQLSMRNSAYFANSPDKESLLYAFDYADSLNTFMETYAGDLTERSQVSVINRANANDSRAKKFTIIGRRAMDIGLMISSFAFHHGERTTREIMFMSAFELSFAKLKREGMSAGEAAGPAARQAHDLMLEALFDYSSYNKPEWMRKYRVPGQFLTYPLAMVNLLTRNMIGIVAGLPDGRTRKQAAQVVFGILARTFLYAGVTGLGLGLVSFSGVMAAITAARDAARPDFEDADEEEKEVWYTDGVAEDYSNPFSTVDLEFWFRNYFIPKYFGEGSSLATFFKLTPGQADLLARSVEVGPISAITDVSIGPRVALNALLFRDDTRREDAQDTIEGQFFKLAGPTGGMAISLYQSQQEMVLADSGRDWNIALQKATPAIGRGVLKAYQLSDEGWIPKREFIARDGFDRAYFTWNKVVAQALGFSSTKQVQERDLVYQYNKMRFEIDAKRVEVINAVKDKNMELLTALEAQAKAREALDFARADMYGNRADTLSVQTNQAEADLVQFNHEYPADAIENMTEIINEANKDRLDPNRGRRVTDKTPTSQLDVITPASLQ